MPPALAPALGLAIGVSVATAQVIIAVAFTALSVAASFLFAPKPKKPESLGETQELAREDGFTLESRNPVLPRRFVYGTRRLGGHVIFMGTTDSNKYLHWISYIADGPVFGLPVVLLDDYPIYSDDLDSDGLVTRGRYANKVRIKKHLGGTAQTADSDATNELSEWTSDHRLRGMAYIYVRMEYDRDVFSNGRPAISAVCQGLLCTDPRITGDDYHCQNPVLAWRDFLLRTRQDGGLGAIASEIDDTDNGTQATICDGQAAVVQKDVTAQGIESTDISPTGDSSIDLTGDILEFQLGDTIRVSSTGDVPGGLAPSTDYFCIPVHWWKRAEPDGVITAYPRLRLATTLHNALEGEFITLTDGGSGTITLSKTAEPRYTVNGVVTHDRKPADVIGDFMSAMQGRMAHLGGVFRVRPATYVTPTIDFDESVCIGKVSTPSKISRRERFNRLSGTYADPRVRWILESYPSVQSATYVTEDNGEVIRGTVNLPFTSRNTTAQRLAAIALKRNRNQVRLRFTTHLAGLQIDSLGTFTFTNAVRGLAAQPFEVEAMTLGQDRAGALTVTIDGWAVTSTDYDYTPGSEEVAPRSVKVSSLPNPFTVAAPVSLRASTEYLQGVPRIVVQWDSPADFFIRQDGNAELTYRRSNGRALAFDGAQYGTFATALDFGGLSESPSAFTFESYVQWNGATGADCSIFHNGQLSLYWRDSDGKIVAEFSVGESPEIKIESAAAPAASDWTHVAVTWDGATARLYIDGTLDDSDATLGTLGAAAADSEIGRGKNGVADTAYFCGAIDDVRVWDYARSAAQISGAYQSPLDGDEAGLIAYIPFEVFNESYASDDSGSSNYLTLTGSPDYALGTVAPDYEAAHYVDADRLIGYVAPVEDGGTYDLQVRFRNSIGVVSSASAILSYTVGSPAAGAPSLFDEGLFSEPVTLESEEGLFSQSAYPIDEGTFV